MFRRAPKEPEYRYRPGQEISGEVIGVRGGHTRTGNPWYEVALLLKDGRTITASFSSQRHSAPLRNNEETSVAALSKEWGPDTPPPLGTHITGKVNNTVLASDSPHQNPFLTDVTVGRTPPTINGSCEEVPLERPATPLKAFVDGLFS